MDGWIRLTSLTDYADENDVKFFDRKFLPECFPRANKHTDHTSFYSHIWPLNFAPLTCILQGKYQWSVVINKCVSYISRIQFFEYGGAVYIGVANLVIFPNLFEIYRKEILLSKLIIVAVQLLY